MHRTIAGKEAVNLSGGRPSVAGNNRNGPAHERGSVIHTSSSTTSGTVTVYQDSLEIRTIGEFDVIDITEEVQSSIRRSGVKEGQVLIYSPHTTCALLLNEKESGLLADINTTLSRLVPQAAGYLHDDFTVRTENMGQDETPNAHAHLRQVLGGRTSEHIPVRDGCLLLGKWQRVMFVEFDCSRDRKVFIQVLGV